MLALQLSGFDLASQLPNLVLEPAVMHERGFPVLWILVQEPLENDRIQLQPRKYRIRL